ncbi:ATP-grasp domain-containing protein [Streptomyces mangrovisoli]|uniref:Biotin carboxylase n=1 Tax=Streptomyces mangrovisoli TaxID=1428628 RepID=A0A1J4NMJ1_9ACTN|nr:biotin carboxylase [Streptomyces mangrovisoli]OIJ63633.1 biotin carboxylase [Streptomyces mangrovisoli]
MTGNPPDAGGRTHVVIVNRWKEQYAEYARYLDHAVHRVTYVSTGVGRHAVPAAAADTVTVTSTEDLAEVRAAVHTLARRHGRPHGVVALKEGDLMTGARLREEWDLPGPRTTEIEAFRDKYLMCRAVARAGLPVPEFRAVDDADSVLALGRRAGWPLVVKPRVGGSSDGVLVLRGPEDLAALPDPAARPLLVQAFNPHPIYHVDGVFDGRRATCLRASRYVNSCLGFRDDGTFLGSVEEDDPAVNRAVATAATAFLRALTSGPTPFHLELFVARRGGQAHCVFLEVGARVGGAEIPFVWREVHGYDLMRAAFDLQLGRRPRTPPGPAGGAEDAGGTEEARGAVGGWLLVPAPTSRPCVITEATPMTGRRPGPYAEALLRPGEVLPDADAYYEHVGGRFRFQGGSSAEVETALTATAAHFRVSAEPVEPLTARIPEVSR